MPNLGEIVKPKDIGLKGTNLMMWYACPTCRKEYWVGLKGGKPRNIKCRTCANHGEKLSEPKGTIENPVINDIRRAKEFGFNNRHLRQYRECPQCHQPRWVDISDPLNMTCVSCKNLNQQSTGNKNFTGIHRKRTGYVSIYVERTDFFHEMADDNHHVPEHRLVMAKYLGRNLTPFEVVHHKNGIKDDNRIENLELSTKHAHIKDHSKGYQDGFMKGYVDGVNRAVDEKINKLNQEIRLLQLQLKGELR